MDAQTIEKGFERIWKLFEETDRKFQETDRKFQETDRKFQENERKSEREFQELRLSMREMSQETDRKFQETDQRLKELSETVKETSLEVKQMSKKVERVSEELGHLGNRLGEFVEYLIKPALVKLFQTRGIEVHRTYRDIEVNNPTLNMAMQIDLLIVNILICILVEVKSHLSVDDVNEHLERMEKFKSLFPEYQKHQVMGAVAGMVMAEEVARYAYRKGFFVIGQKGETAVILNDDKFKPMIW